MGLRRLLKVRRVLRVKRSVRTAFVVISASYQKIIAVYVVAKGMMIVCRARKDVVIKQVFTESEN